VILLARLAVDVSLQGKGIGPALLKDALLRVAGYKKATVILWPPNRPCPGAGNSERSGTALV
jgi:predicted N-acetyltransferase YhbS